MKNKSNRKKIVIASVAVVLVAAIGVGIWFGTSQANAEPVNVYPFHYLGMTEYWGDSQESYGPVTTDKIQTVFLSDTQTVTEIMVCAGDTVKKGDVLMTFDTTLSDLALERKRLDVEKLKLQVEDAKDRLREINNMKPMVIPTVTEEEEEEENLGTALTEDYRISTQTAYDGSSKEKALICWLNSSTSISNTIMEDLRQTAEEFQNANARKQSSSASAPAEEQTQTPPAETQPQETQPQETQPQQTQPQETQPQETQPQQTQPQETQPSAMEPSVPGEPSDEDYEPFHVNDYYVIIKVTSGNMSLGTKQVWQGMHVSGSAGSGFCFSFFDAYSIMDYTLAQEDAEASQRPQIDLGSGYTSAQIAELRSEQQKTIKDLEFDLKMAEADYKIMQTEVNDGRVYAEIDGEVVSVLTEDEAKQMMQPIVKVSGGGGYYVQGSVSELEKDNMEIGQEVTVNDWNTGMVYTGTVDSMGDFPSSDGYWNGIGNPNVSYYPFTVFVEGSADLQAGNYVSVMYSSATSENGIYLENPFIRTEKGESYVYVLGENGKLEKRIVTVGKSLWGSYTEVLSGLSEEDYIAFPYGKNVKDGAPAVQSDDMSTLYNY